MKATEAKLLDFLKKSPQFLIPIYQRTYSWTETECRQLWDDIVRTGSNPSLSAHFVGSIVYIEKGLYQVTTQSPLLVIDGQQRLTTVTLLIAALADALNDTEPVDGFSRRKLTNYYLLNPEESGEKHYKLLLSQTDKASLISIVSGIDQPSSVSRSVTENFKLFQTLIKEQGENLIPICSGLAKLMVVDISLNRDQDNPQLIFESMNSTGRELTQADLIRNFVLMGLDPEVQDKLYNQFWRPMELDFGQEAYGTHFDSFMRHYLTFKTRDIPNVHEVYDAFKKHAHELDVEVLVKDIRHFAKYFCAMALGAEGDPDLALAFQDLRQLKVDVAYPFLLELYDDYANKLLSKADFEAAVRLIESFVFRRAVCSIPTNSLNRIFAAFSKGVKKDRYLESVTASFLNLPSYRRFPGDDEFAKELKSRDMYNFGTKRAYWLHRLENHDRKERVPVSEYTIEHIIPQNDKLSSAWKTALGPEWKRIRDQWLHTLGNLTLSGYNSEYSDRPFEEKRDMKGGFKESPIRLNTGLGSLEAWNEQAIQTRADRLAAVSLQVWSAPQLDPDVLAKYRDVPDFETYSIADHPSLLDGNWADLFAMFRKQILALDPCVSEEFLKFYVVYKAETTFVTLIPQTKKFQVQLNMNFRDVDDPKYLCKDVSTVGHWSTGEVSFAITTPEELPYAMGLIRQSFDKQMGNDD